MSVTATMEYYTRPFNQDPFMGSPGGLWVARGEVTGDASGGKRQLNWNVTDISAGDVNALYYSLEDLQVADLSELQEAAMIIRGMDPSPLSGSLTRPYELQLQSITASVGFTQSTFRLGQRMQSPNLFLGRPSTDPLVTNQVSFDIANLDLATFGVRASGYWWWQGAINAPLGFRKPPDGLYST